MPAAKTFVWFATLVDEEGLPVSDEEEVTMQKEVHGPIFCILPVGREVHVAVTQPGPVSELHLLFTDIRGKEKLKYLVSRESKDLKEREVITVEPLTYVGT